MNVIVRYMGNNKNEKKVVILILFLQMKHAVVERMNLIISKKILFQFPAQTF